MTDTPSEPPPLVPAAPAAKGYGRAGRNLPAAIGVGVGLGAWVILSLLFFKPAFVVLIALALVLGSIELSQAFRRHMQMTAAVIPIAVGTVAIATGSYLAGRQDPVVFSSTSVLLASLALTVLAALVWRLPQGAPGFVRDMSASLGIIAYVPLLGSFVPLMLAGEHGAARVVSFLLIVVLNDVGGYVFGVLFGKHQMAPRISPKKSWEGFAGSVVFGITGGVLMAIYGLHVSFWVGVLLGAGLVAVGTCGDLVESMIKRDLGIKDMSSFLPGHGGVMDRLDSLLLAAPVAWLIMYILVPGG